MRQAGEGMRHLLLFFLAFVTWKSNKLLLLLSLTAGHGDSRIQEVSIGWVGQNGQWLLDVHVCGQYGIDGRKERNRGNGLARWGFWGW
jgi:hypothetical protein